MKEKLKKYLFGFDELKNLDLDKLLETPKNSQHGDFTFPCFVLSSDMKKSPIQIAEILNSQFQKEIPAFLEKIQIMGAYINFYLNWKELSKQIIESIKNTNFFKLKNENPQKYLIEWPSPNSNKPLHLGHLRNILLGQCFTNLLEENNNKVIKVNLNNDRGIAICKSMLMYKKYGEGKTPDSENIKSDYFVGKYYQRFENEAELNPSLNNEAQEMLRMWENGDTEILKLWEKMNKWAFVGFEETFKKFNLVHDKVYYESKIYEKGKKIILENKSNLFEKDEDENYIIDLTNEGEDTKVVLRADKTSVYITQDIALAYEKINDFKKVDKYIFIVANEQSYHFKVLFLILSKLGFGDIDKFYHFAYGMINLPQGKMSSRKGTVIYLDELYSQVKDLALQNLKLKDLTNSLNSSQLEQRAKIIRTSAINFFILKNNPLDNFIFDINKSLSFIGETGPYVQYTYARICSIIKKSKVDIAKIEICNLGELEIDLVKIIYQYRQIVKEAIKKYKPNLICNYLIKLSQKFNEYYQNNKIIGSDNYEVKLLTIYILSIIIKKGLSLLNIEILEEM